jgi:Flp pilus assembly protein TadD
MIVFLIVFLVVIGQLILTFNCYALTTKEYFDQGLADGQQGNLTQAVSDFTKAIEIDPKYGKAYSNRAVLYYHLSDYDKAWADVHKAKELGVEESPRFIERLQEASGRDR